MMKKWHTSAEETRSRARAMSNLIHNTESFSACRDKLLNGQRTKPICDMRYGTYPLSWNGCELIACYNCAAMLGKEISFPQVVFEFELNRMHYLFPNGYWGTAPKKLWYFFDKHGMSYRSYRNGEEFAKYARTEKASCGIISFWNNKRSTAKLHGHDFFSGGLHTVAYRWRAGRFMVYNLYGGDTSARSMSDIAETYREKRFIIGYIFEGQLKG